MPRNKDSKNIKKEKGGKEMKLSIDKEEFSKWTATVARVVSGKTTMPVLSNILIEAKKDTNSLRLAATDLEVTLDCEISAQVESEGAITVPARKLTEIVRELPEAPVYLSTEEDGKILRLDCEKSSFSLAGIPKEEYPALPSFPEKESFSIPQSVLKPMIRKTIFAVSTEEFRYALNGVYFVVDRKELRLVATDGRRLAFVKNELEAGPKEKVAVIVPTRGMQELNTLIDETGGDLQVFCSGNQIHFKKDNVVLTSRLVEGQFPNYEQVIPTYCEKQVILNTNRFMQAVKRVSVLASEKSYSVKFELSKNNIVITANTPELGEAKDEFECVYDGEDFVVAYNAKYILDVLRNIEQEETFLELTQPLSPGVLKPVGDDNYINVIMPIKLA